MTESDVVFEECVCWSYYWKFWNKEYPYFKVNHPSEDICGYCYQFYNRKKYSTSSLFNSEIAGEDESKSKSKSKSNDEE